MNKTWRFMFIEHATHWVSKIKYTTVGRKPQGNIYLGNLTVDYRRYVSASQRVGAGSFRMKNNNNQIIGSCKYSSKHFGPTETRYQFLNKKYDIRSSLTTITHKIKSIITN